jgi:pilus assembly protein CpaE
VRTVLRQENLDESFVRQVRALQPDIVLLEASESGALADWVARLKSAPEPPSVVAIEQSADAELILAAFRSGADDFLHPPIEEKLRSVLEREAGRRRRREESGQRGRILGVLSAKGGCGGTTVACGLAMALASRAAPGVLLLDADFQAGLAGFLTGVNSPHSIADAMENLHRLDLHYWRALVSIGPAGLHVMPACPAGGFQRATDADNLREVMRFARTNYAWTIADLGSGLGPACRAVRDELDLLYLVTTTDVLAMYQCLRVVQGLQANGAGRVGLHLVVNQVGAPPAMTKEEVEKAVDLPVDAVLPEDLAALQLWQGGEHLLEPHGALGGCLAGLVDTLVGAPAKAVPARSLWHAAFGLFQPTRRTA